MYKVKTPNKSFEGKRAGLLFVKGAAEFEDAALVKIFRDELGYEVIEPEEAKPAKPAKPKAKAKAAAKKAE